MNAQEYASLARVTLKVLPFRHHMIHMGLGVAGEFGELIDATKKVYIYGKPVDHVNLVEEVGDCLWYVANLLFELGVSSQVMQRNLELGYAKGSETMAQAAQDMNMGAFLLHLNKVIADEAAALPALKPEMAPGSSAAVRTIEELSGNIGVVAGLMGVNIGEAMERNIAKLTARYGDKFSEHAALHRDLGAERQALGDAA